LIGIFVTGGGAYFTKLYNDRQLQLTQLSALDKFRPLLLSDDPAEREFAYASFRELGYEQLALRIIDLKRDPAGRAVVQDIEQTGSADARQFASMALKMLPVQVYLHIGNAGQESRAKSVAAALQEAGLKSMGIENVAGKASLPDVTQVRYFNEADKDVANKVLDILKSNGVQSSETRLLTFLRAPPGSLEIWFASEIE
jgi:hypothetical protein